MPTNIIRAIINIVRQPKFELMAYSRSHNRANNMGEALEEYIKDVFAGTVGLNDENARNTQLSQTFSYLGNQNNPPDIIIRGGDAIEVKKTESPVSDLALNSSYPKAKLFSGSRMITAECRKCEEWTEKDLIFAVGVCKNNILSQLSFVYGVDYAAGADTYERIETIISNGVNSIPDVEFADTNELARVNRIDPLGITYLRVRGMWGIRNPVRTFDYIYSPVDDAKFNFMAIINSDKFNSFPEADIAELQDLVGKTDNLNIENIKIKDPNNPARLNEAVLIRFAV
ncbi:MAG: NgoPII family restriction endonuclease [Oscillospiraceae bacterium]|nr:NgoPII family restriction endonuclease [Oscillospiraceae bacterium]